MPPREAIDQPIELEASVDVAPMRDLAEQASLAAGIVARSIDPRISDDLVPIVEHEIVARILSLATVVFARSRGFLDLPQGRITQWSDLDAALAPLARRGAMPFRGASEGPLFDQVAQHAISITDEVLASLVESFEKATSNAPEVEALGAVYEELIALRLIRKEGGFVLGTSDARRKAGAHFTPRALTEPIVVRTLEPLVGRDPLEVRVCDPAMGSGAFLLEACRYLAMRVRERSPKMTESAALKRVAEKCIFGVDRDARAVDLARISLWLLVGSQSLSPDFADASLVRGDALIGRIDRVDKAASRDTLNRELARQRPELRPAIADKSLEPLHWNIAFPAVIGRRGFDAMVGNPPWVSYAGRAAQPLADGIRAYYGATYDAFHGYRNLQALFVERALTLLRPGGRIGFVVPTSMSDLAGYEPSRRAHDALAICDTELADLEDGGFLGVFQPCMALLSTRRPEPLPLKKTGVWPLARHDLDDGSRDLLAELGAYEALPRELFGERGFQSTSEDVRQFTDASIPPSTTPLRVGGDVAAFIRKPPHLFCNPRVLEGRFRAPEAWREVAIYIRQTARYPMATRSDGLPFRNSVLAGFTNEVFDAAFLVAYLNSSPIRWYHYMRHRDARQGMPQLKIAHLRALPAPPKDHPRFADLRAFGERLDARQSGISDAEQAELDEWVCDLFELGSNARATVDSWVKARAKKEHT